MKKWKEVLVLALPLMLLIFANTAAGKADNERATKKTEKRGRKNSEDNRRAEIRKVNSSNIAAKKNALAASEKLLSSAAIGRRFLLDKPVAEFTESDKRKIYRELESLRQRKTTQQFLSIIQIAEAGQPNIVVGDKPGCRVTNLKKHPGEVLPKRCFYYFYNKGKLYYSTASGNYQITRQNYRILAPFLSIKDFEVPGQQLLALEIVRRGGRKPKQVRKGFEALVRGDVREAVRLGTPDWASIPGSDLPGCKRRDINKIINRALNETPAKTKTAQRKALQNVRR